TDEPWRLVFLHGESGASAAIYADAMETDAYKTMAKTAKGLSAKPRRLLFIGDSLSDQKRGYNYVDKIGYWLAECVGDRGSVKNVGVGGDFISRVWQRLNKDPKSYRLNMYEGIFDPKPTRVFIFLGHNDSKAKSTTNYTTHCVAPETFEDEYRKTIRKIQADTGAPVTVVSATSSVYEITKASADKRGATGKAHNLFGRPDHLELFNAIAKRVAAETGCDYVDVYTPTRDHTDKPSLFTGDGVHLSNPGNRYIALLLLQYLSMADNGTLPRF
ncbi:MAG: hypothetical protein HQ546_04570, partial [Planctomycetes bacterium]|nr:hypothetical protein [Planctomycetota bacterium]